MHLSRQSHAALYYNRKRRKYAANLIVNEAPTANAGDDQTVSLASGATMAGSMSDDRLPKGILTVRWAKQSGPGTVTFENASDLTTPVTFSQTGSYVLRLTISDGVASDTDNVTVVVE